MELVAQRVNCEVRRGGLSRKGLKGLAHLLDQVAELADPSRRIQARAALAAAAEPVRLHALREGTSHPWWRVRRWSCRLLEDETLDHASYARLVAAARGDSHKSVRCQALKALVYDSYTSGCHPPEERHARYDLVGLLLERLRNDRSISVRRAAATGLWYQVVLNANRQRRVQRALRRALTSEADPTIFRRAHEALGELAGTGQAGPYAGLGWALGHGRTDLALRLVRGHMGRWEANGDFGEASTWLERVVAASERASPSLLAPVLHDAGLAAMVSGDLDAAARHLRASMTQWDRAGGHVGRVRTKSLLAFLASFADDPHAIADLEAHVAELRAMGDDGGLFEVLAACGQARMFTGSPHLARPHFEQAVALAGQAGLGSRIATGLIGLGSAELAQGDYASAEAHLAEGVVRTEAAGDTHSEVIGRCWLAEVDRVRGEGSRARSQLEECVERGRAMGAPYPLALAVFCLARAVFGGGDLDRARSLFEEALAVAAAARLGHLMTVALIGQAEVALAQGHTDAAVKLLKLARSRARQRGDALATAGCSYHLGQLARARGHPQRAGSFHDEALALREGVGERAGVADSLEALASLATISGSDDKAVRLFAAAEALREANGYVRSRLQEGAYEADVALLRERMDHHDLQLAWGKGGAMPQREAVWYARRGRGPRVRPSRGWEALTPAQRRVAELVAQGLSNAEVADRLFIGQETVKSHVSEVLAKLGMSSRWEVRDAPSIPAGERD